MIYRQTGYKSNKLTAINIDTSPLQALSNVVVPTIEQDINIKKYKANQMLYFLSGDITPNEDGSYTRNDSNLNSRDLIVIDIEDTGKTSEEAVNIIQDRLQGYKYLLYSSISHKPDNPRLRLVLEPSRGKYLKMSTNQQYSTLWSSYSLIMILVVVHGHNYKAYLL